MADNLEEQKIKLTIDTNAKEVAKDTNKLGVEIEKVVTANKENTAVVGKEAEVYKTFKTQLREANAELQKQIQLTGESSQETIKAAKAVADLKDQMEFASAISDQFNPDQKMKALSAATQIAGTGLQGVTAGMALFGGESEDTQKQLLKVQAAMAFSDAISNLSNLGDQWKLLKATIQASSIATKANTAATGAAAIVQNLFTGSVTTTSAGFKALKFAIAATGIGLLVVAIGLAVANFDKLKSVMSNIGWMKAVGDTISKIVNSVTDFVGLTSESDRVLDRQKKSYEKAIAQNEKYLERNASIISDARKKEIELSNEHFKRVAEGRFSDAESKKIFQEALHKEELEAQEKRDKEIQDKKDKASQDARAKREKSEADAKAQKEKEAEELAKLIQQQFENEKAEREKIRIAIEEAQNEIALKDLSKQEREILAVNDKYFLLLEKAKEFNFSKEEIDALNQEKRREIQKINNEYELEEQKKKDEAEIEQKKKTDDLLLELENQKENSKKEIAEKGIGFLNVIAGKNKVIQKAAIIAEGAIGVARSIKNTVEGNAGTLAKSILQLGPVAGPPAATPAITLNTIAGGLSVATTVAQTAKALQALGGGGGVSGGGAPSFGGGGGVPQATPTVAFNNTAENQIGQSLSKAQTEQPPLKVYVAESDISDAQNNVKVLVEKNTL